MADHGADEDVAEKEEEQRISAAPAVMRCKMRGCLHRPQLTALD
jgi:hypothetical protein